MEHVVGICAKFVPITAMRISTRGAPIIVPEFHQDIADEIIRADNIRQRKMDSTYSPLPYAPPNTTVDATIFRDLSPNFPLAPLEPVVVGATFQSQYDVQPVPRLTLHLLEELARIQTHLLSPILHLTHAVGDQLRAQEDEATSPAFDLIDHFLDLLLKTTVDLTQQVIYVRRQAEMHQQPIVDLRAVLRQRIWGRKKLFERSQHT